MLIKPHIKQLHVLSKEHVLLILELNILDILLDTIKYYYITKQNKTHKRCS